MIGLFDYPLWILHAKRSFTHNVVTDPVVKEACLKFLDSQQDFHKMLVDNTTTLTKHFIDSQTKCWYPTGDKK